MLQKVGSTRTQRVLPDRASLVCPRTTILDISVKAVAAIRITAIQEQQVGVRRVTKTDLRTGNKEQTFAKI